jgi:hypothetical protein
MNDKLIVSGFEIDLTDGVAFPLNFSIADFKEPQSRKRSFSKQITIQGTQNNLNIFFTTFNLTVSDIGSSSVFQFDPTIQQPCEYFKDGILIFKGLFHLKEVKYFNGNYSFVCELLSDVVDLFSRLKNIRINELIAMQKYQHLLNRTNIINSFDTSVIINGVATSNFTGSNPDGFGYLYPLVDYGYNRPVDTTFNIAQLIPHWYVRELFVECFRFSGLDIDSNFLNSQFAKNLVIGSGDGTILQLDSTEIGNRRVELDLSTQAFFPAPISNLIQGVAILNASNNVLPFGWITSSVDPSNQYVGSGSNEIGSIVVQKTGSYKIKYISDALLEFGTDGTVQAGDFPLNYTVIARRNGAIVSTQTYTTIFNSTFTSINVGIDFEADLTLNQNDAIEIEMKIQCNAVVSSATFFQFSITDDVITAPTTFRFTSLDTTLIEGSTIAPVRAIPNMIASDFVASIIKMFNLYVGDPVDGVVEIEPYADFYKSSNDTINWTNKVDYSKEIIIKPASTIDGKFYNFEFQDDADYFRKLYSDTWGAGYGDRRYEVPSTFQTGEKTNKLGFSQSVISDRNTGLLMPCILTFDQQTLAIKPFKGKPRVYFYNGLKTGNWRIEDVLTTTGDNLTNYPSIHHFDDWENPTFDLNFQLPEELYYTTTDITFTNLWSEFHRDFILELTGRDSKILNLNVRLNPDDISKLDFGKLVNIEGVLYRLNQIKDFDSNITESTKIELMKYLG